MEKSTYISQLLHSIAKEINKPIETVEPFIKMYMVFIFLINCFCSLEENWYDSFEAVQELDEEKLDKMKIPQRLAQLILTKISKSGSTYINPKKELDVPLKIQMIKDSTYDDLFFELQKSVLGNDMYISTLNTMKTLLNNIIQNPKEEKFLKIKVNNKAFAEKIKPYPAAIKILKQVLKD